MHWWQWVLQITGAWFYLGLIVLTLWHWVISWRRRRLFVPKPRRIQIQGARISLPQHDLARPELSSELARNSTLGRCTYRRCGGSVWPLQRQGCPNAADVVMRFRPPPARHWRSYGGDKLPTGAEALSEPFAAFPCWFMRIECHRCATSPGSCGIGQLACQYPLFPQCGASVPRRFRGDA
jgi:hypothetical protein